MGETFNIKQDFDLAEYLIATFYVTAKMKMVRRIFLFGTIIGLLNAILDTTLSTEGKNLFFIIWKFLFLPLFLFLFFGAGITILSIIIYKLKPQFFKEINYRFNNWGMEKFGDKVNVSVPWNHFLKYHESKDSFYLFLNNNHSHIVQKRMFNSTEEIENFRNFISQKIEKK